MRPRGWGLSLAELLVAMAISLLMLGLVSVSIVSYLRATRQLLPQGFSSRSLATGLDHASRLLRNVVALYAPEPSRLEEPFTPTPENPLVVAVAQNGGLLRTGLALDRARHGLAQLEFLPGLEDARQARLRRLGDAQGFTVQLDPRGDRPLFWLRVEGPAPVLPLATALVSRLRL